MKYLTMFLDEISLTSSPCSEAKTRESRSPPKRTEPPNDQSRGRSVSFVSPLEGPERNQAEVVARVHGPWRDAILKWSEERRLDWDQLAAMFEYEGGDEREKAEYAAYVHLAAELIADSKTDRSVLD